MHLIMTEIANNVLWLTRIGKWALGVIGVGIMIGLSTVGYFNSQIQDLNVSVKSSEVRISNLIERNTEYRWDNQ